MSTEENKALVRRYLEEAWNKGNVGVIDTLMATDYSRYMSEPAKPLTREGQKQRITTFRQALPGSEAFLANGITRMGFTPCSPVGR